MVKLLKDSAEFKIFDVYDCPTPTCEECTGSYISEGLGIRFICHVISPHVDPRRRSIPSKPKRKSPRRDIELKAKIKELCLAGKSPIQIGNILGKTKEAIYPHIKNLIQDGELYSSQTSYVKAGPSEERKWYKIIERTLE